jgi:hypothetical protein
MKWRVALIVHLFSASLAACNRTEAPPAGAPAPTGMAGGAGGRGTDPGPGPGPGGGGSPGGPVGPGPGSPVAPPVGGPPPAVADGGMAPPMVVPPAAQTEERRAGALIPPGKPTGLPMVVTEHYQNRGWFGDPDIVSRFAGSGMIQEAGASTGELCTSRRTPGARGKCMEFSFKPPAERMLPAEGGYVGDYLLTTLQFPHPEASPTPHKGEANWGYEPAVALPPGATRVSFYAAAPEPVAVTFTAGVGRDQFDVPEVTHTLTPEWQPYSISLEGVSYGTNVFGAFGWTLKETTRAARFFIDGVVWEGSGAPPNYPQPPRPMLRPPTPPAAENPAPPTVPAGQRNGTREFLFENRCKETVWVAAFGEPVPAGGGFRLDAGQRRTENIPGGRWTGRFWGRTGCRFNAAGVGSCESGTCGSVEKCPGSTGKPPVTLAEFTLGDGAGNDTYDVSLVDGFNLPMAIVPMPGTFTRGARQDGFDCGAPTCAKDYNAICPAQLRFNNSAGSAVGCFSACTVFETDQFCCRGAFATEPTCPPTEYSRFFKAACPSAYSYAYDDKTSTFVCKGEDYAIVFCPGG